MIKIGNKLGLSWAKLSSSWNWDLLSFRFDPFMNRLKLTIKLVYWNWPWHYPPHSTHPPEKVGKPQLVLNYLLFPLFLTQQFSRPKIFATNILEQIFLPKICFDPNFFDNNFFALKTFLDQKLFLIHDWYSPKAEF